MDKGVSRLFLIFTALTCGILIMVIEVIGSRLMGPFFGVSLFVWTSLIAVTMISLAAGYMIGGILSDQAKSPDILYILIALAGVCVLVIPFVKIPVLKLCLAFGLRGGALVASLALFAPSLTLLGCVSPFVIRIATREVSSVGRTVGSFYALSTIGSVLGTVLTGFIFVAYMAVNNIFFLVGLLLVGLAISYFVFFRGKFVAVALLLPVIALPLVAPTSVDSKIMENGSIATVIDRTNSIYSNIKVLDINTGKMTTRQMVIDGLIQGVVDVENGLSIGGISYLLQHVPVAYNPNGKRCLVVGLGPGIVPQWYMAQGIETDVVDIDPAVIEIASRYFNYSAGEQVVIEDARNFLGKGEEKYDYIILDVFNGDITPSHILSKEMFSLIKNRLNYNGVFAMNLIGDLRENSVMTASVIKTLEAVFGKTTIMPLFHPQKQKGYGFGNIAIFAHSPELQAPKRIKLPGKIHPHARFQVSYALQNSYSMPVHPDAMILTDEYNPIDFYDLELKEKIRKEILKNTDWDIMLD
jgi:spermidine synthase